jgi:ABC-type transport system substrate-binding protein
MTLVPDRTAAFNAFRGRQVDITPILGTGYINAEQAETIKKEMPQATVFLTQMLPWPHIKFNTTVKPLDDKRVRQAFSYMTDRDQLIAKTWSGNAKIVGPLPAELRNWALPEATLRAHPLYKRDVAKAKQLLTDAGVSLPFKVRLTALSANADQVAVLTQQWGEAGVNVESVVTADSATTYTIMEKGDFETVYFGHSGYQDPDDYFSTYVSSDGPRNYGKFSNKELDDLILKQRKTINEADRQKIVTDIQTKILEESPNLYLTSTPAHLAAQPYVKNFWVNPIAYGGARYWDSVWFDK